MLKRPLQLALLVSSAWIAQAASAGDLTLFTGGDFSGREVNVRGDVRTLDQLGFNDRANSMVVRSGTWEVCVHADFGGECRVYEPGQYRSLDRLNGQVSSVREIAGFGGGNAYGYDRDDRREERRERRANRRGGRDPEVMLFDATGLRGRSISVRGDTNDLNSAGFNDQTQSMVVEGGTWEMCQHRDFRGPCRTFEPGQYNILDRGFHRSITSIRLVGVERGRGNGNGYGYGQRDDYQPRRDGVELFSETGFRGQATQVQGELRTLDAINFNDRAGSLIVSSGEWEFCQHADFRGQCMTYGPGRYDRLGSLQFAISSMRRVR